MNIITIILLGLFQTLTVDDNYCGDHQVNYPIDGQIPVTKEAVCTFSKTASAITVAVDSDNTVAFVGTTSGHIVKVSL